jgi:hypothetical protein
MAKFSNANGQKQKIVAPGVHAGEGGCESTVTLPMSLFPRSGYVAPYDLSVIVPIKNL